MGGQDRNFNDYHLRTKTMGLLQTDITTLEQCKQWRTSPVQGGLPHKGPNSNSKHYSSLLQTSDSQVAQKAEDFQKDSLPSLMTRADDPGLTLNLVKLQYPSSLHNTCSSAKRFWSELLTLSGPVVQATSRFYFALLCIL